MNRSFYSSRLWRSALVFAAIPVVAACSSSAPSTTPQATAPASGAVTAAPANLTVQLNFIANAEHYGITYADRAGLYKAQNLTVKVNPGGQGVDGLQMVAAGAADIAVSDPAAMMTAVNQGIPVVAFAAEFHKTPQAMICRKDRGVSQISEINGKTFGVKSATGEEQTRAFLTKNNIDVAKIKTSPIGASSVTEIIAGVVDCQLGFAVNEPNSMRKAGVEPTIFLLADYGFPSQGNIYITNSTTLEKNKDALGRWVKATAAGWDNFLQDPSAAAKWIIDNKIVDGLDLDQQTAQAKGQAPLIADEFTKQYGLLYLDMDSWQAAAKEVVAQKRTDKAPDLNTVLTFTVLDQVYPKH
jgi:NitT/TauT family transport system substrate-binding protein